MTEEKKIEEQEDTGLSHLKGSIKQIDVTLADYDETFNPKHNVRDPNLYGDRVARKVTELLADKAIRNPLVICKIDDNYVAACGFVRRQALCQIQRKYPEEFEKYFAKVPVRVVLDCTERDRELLMTDHGSEEGLNEYEVFTATVRLMKQNLKDKEIVGVMAKMYLALLSEGAKQKYMAKLSELVKEGFVMSGSTKVRTVIGVQIATFRGRLQYFQRLHRAPGSSIIVEAFQKNVMREKGGVKITYKMAEVLEKMPVEEVQDYLDKVRDANKGEGPQKPTESLWGAAKLSRSRNNMKSNAYQTLLDAALGKGDAQTEIPDIDDELLRIEAAMGHNPEKFWLCVDEILADLEQINEQADANVGN